MIRNKVEYTCRALSEGTTLEQVTHALDDERVHTVEEGLGRWWKKVSGDDVRVKFHTIANSARRKNSKLVKKYLAFDPLFNVEVWRNEKHVMLEHFTDEAIPRSCTPEGKDIAWAITTAAPACSDLALSGCNILNVVIPTAAAQVCGYPGEPGDIAQEAERGAYVTGGIPGGKAAAMKVAALASEIYAVLNPEQ